MISAQGARDLGSYEAQLAAILETIENHIRRVAPSSRSRKTRISLDLAGIPNSPLLGEVCGKLRDEGFVISTSLAQYCYEGSSTWRSKIALSISWE